MAELCVVVGGLASFAQLLAYVFQVSNTINAFCDACKDGPAEVARINQKLNVLRKGLGEIQQYLQTFGDVGILPPDLMQTIFEAMRGVENDIKEIQKASRATLRDSSCERLKWALRDRGKMKKLLDRLESSEGTLDRVIQLVNL